MSSSRTTKPSLRERQRELTRQSIFEATLEAFGEKGYVSVTVDDIVSRAGISRATFYLHFDSKASVLRELRNQRLNDWLEEGSARWGASRDSLQAFFEKMVDFYLESPVLYKALHEARAADPDFAAAHRQLMEQNVEAWAIEPGENPSKSQIRLHVAMIYTMLDYFMHLWLNQGWELGREEAIRAMTDALHATMTLGTP